MSNGAEERFIEFSASRRLSGLPSSARRQLVFHPTIEENGEGVKPSLISYASRRLSMNARRSDKMDAAFMKAFMIQRTEAIMTVAGNNAMVFADVRQGTTGCL